MNPTGICTLILKGQYFSFKYLKVEVMILFFHISVPPTPNRTAVCNCSVYLYSSLKQLKLVHLSYFRTTTQSKPTTIRIIGQLNFHISVKTQTIAEPQTFLQNQKITDINWSRSDFISSWMIETDSAGHL